MSKRISKLSSLTFYLRFTLRPNLFGIWVVCKIGFTLTNYDIKMLVHEFVCDKAKIMNYSVLITRRKDSFCIMSTFAFNKNILLIIPLPFYSSNILNSGLFIQEHEEHLSKCTNKYVCIHRQIFLSRKSLLCVS